MAKPTGIKLTPALFNTSDRKPVTGILAPSYVSNGAWSLHRSALDPVHDLKVKDQSSGMRFFKGMAFRDIEDTAFERLFPKPDEALEAVQDLGIVLHGNAYRYRLYQDVSTGTLVPFQENMVTGLGLEKQTLYRPAGKELCVAYVSEDRRILVMPVQMKEDWGLFKNLLRDGLSVLKR